MICSLFQESKKKKRVNFGIARFYTPDNSQFLSVSIPVFPSSTIVSLNRNIGRTQGDIQLTPTGLRLGKITSCKKTWQISFESVMFVNESSPPVNPVSVANVFIVLNGQFNPDLTETNLIGSVVFLPFPGPPQVAQGNGILFDIPGGTEISLFATATGGSGVNIIEPAWFLSASEMFLSASEISPTDKCCKRRNSKK